MEWAKAWPNGSSQPRTEPDGAPVGLLRKVLRPGAHGLGPVLDLQDVIGGKACALASRAEPRDYIDTAAILRQYDPDTVIGFARRLDPGLEDQDFADAGARAVSPVRRW
jgi:hypothetical protein